MEAKELLSWYVIFLVSALLIVVMASCGDSATTISADNGSQITTGDQNEVSQTEIIEQDQESFDLCIDVCLERGNSPRGIEQSDCVNECSLCADACGAFRGDCYDECTGNAQPDTLEV